MAIRRDGLAFYSQTFANPESLQDPAVQDESEEWGRKTVEINARLEESSSQWMRDHGFEETDDGNFIIDCLRSLVRAALGFVLWIGVVAYSITWLVVAIASDPTWWWFVPIYGDIQIFQESVWWGVFHAGIFPLVIIAGIVMED